MNIRKSIATALRSFEAYDVAARIEQRLYLVEIAASRLAQRLDPVDPAEWTGEGWTDMGWVTSADAFGGYVAPLQGRAAESRAAWDAVLAPILARLDAGSIWRTPAPRTAAMTEESIEKISEAMKKPVSVSVDFGAIRYPLDFEVPTPFVDFEVPTPFVDSAFHDFDVRPYMDMIDGFARDLARQQHESREQRMADWLDDVGSVAPGFGADAAREIVAERERPLP
jgi:hypothetical protein